MPALVVPMARKPACSKMRALAASLAGPVELHLLPCLYGHDMFLKEAETVGRLVAPFLGA